MRNWYDNITAQKDPPQKGKVDAQYADGVDMTKLSRLARGVNNNSFEGALSSNMAKYGLFGTVAGLIAGILTKKNIMLLTLAGAGVGSIAGYVVDVRASMKDKSSNLNETTEE